VIFGRPTNLWLGLVTAGLAFVQVLIVTLVPTADPIAVATIIGSLGGLLAVIIALVANQPPAVKEGDPFVVVTPAGQANETRTA